MFNKGFESDTKSAIRRRLLVLAMLAAFASATQAQPPAASASSANPGVRNAVDLARQLSEAFGAQGGTQPQLSAAHVPPALVDEARRAAAAGNRRHASEVLWKAVPSAPDDVEALALLGRVELDQVHCGALAQVQHAAELRPADPVVGVLLARMLTTCGGEPVQAERSLDLWIGDPQTPPAARAEALAWRALVAVDRGGDALKGAEGDIRAALRADDRVPLPWKALFHLHVNQDKFEDARADIDRMAAAGAPPQDVALSRGILLECLKRHDEAEIELSRTLAIEPGHVIALLVRSRERRHRDDLDGALKDSQELVTHQRDNPDYWDELMLVQFDRGDYASAREAVDQKIRLVPERARFLAERAELDGPLGDYKGAVEDYDRSLAMDPSDPDAWIDRATPLWRLDRGSDAVASCLKGLALSDTPRHRSTCAVIEWQVGDDARAVETLDRVLARKEGIETIDSEYWRNNLAMEMLSYGRMKDFAAWWTSSKKDRKDADWTYGAVFLYVARALSGEEAAARVELAARPAPAKARWEDHLVDYAAHRIDDDALVRLASVGAPDDLPGQACESLFYRGLRHWIDGDVAGGRALLADSASSCPRTFNETRIARGWLAAGPGASRTPPANPGKP